MKRALLSLMLILTTVPAMAQFTPSPNTIGSPPNGYLLNTGDDDIKVYCVPGGVSVWNTNRITAGEDELVFEITLAEVQAAVQQAINSGQNTLIASGTRGVFLYALTSSELQAVIDEPLRSRFDFVFSASRCGAIQVTTAPTATTDSTLSTPVSITTSAEMAQNPYTLYVVQEGDTLFRIANRYNTTVANLSAINTITNTSLIYPGQWIFIPDELAAASSNIDLQVP